MATAALPAPAKKKLLIKKTVPVNRDEITWGWEPAMLNPCSSRAYPLMKFNLRTWYWIRALY